MNSLLIDTNILIYAIDEDSKFHLNSKKLIENSNYNLYTTSKNISEFLVVLTRAQQISVPIEETMKLLDKLLT